LLLFPGADHEFYDHRRTASGNSGIGAWIVPIQDAMPDSMRNSFEWRQLLPFAAGTGRDPEAERQRSELILGWLWNTILPQLQTVADQLGFGVPWADMCQ